MSHVFFSYSRANSETAAEFVAGLRKNGFPVWQDVSTLRGGDEWKKAIQSNVAGADAFVVLWSEPASKSEWVQKEVEIAAKYPDKLIIPLWLDEDVDLSTELSEKYAIKLDQGVERSLNQLIEALPQDIRRRKLGFDPAKTLGDQSPADARRWSVDEEELVAVPLLESSYCKAYVVGETNMQVGQPEVIQLCLQFTRTEAQSPIPDIYKTHREANDSGTFVGLYIVGPYSTGKQSYYIENEESAAWVDAVDTIIEAIEALMVDTTRPTLQVFALATLPLMLALGMKLWRFWHLQIYNYVQGGRYVRVMDIQPDQ